jgi:hypothetical protein
MKKNKLNSDNQLPTESIYYYLENGLVVFKEAYHLKRGFCCKRGCRHCPYGNSPEDRAAKGK